MKIKSHPIPLLCLVLAALLLAIFTLTRIGLLVYAGIDSVPPALWPSVFFKGLWFDLAVTCALLAPAFLYDALLPNSWRRSRWHARLRLFWLWLSVSILLFGAVSEATFWLEFSTRFNFIALDYLIYTQEVIGNIRESYPVGWIFSGIGLVAALVVWKLAGAINRADQSGLSGRQRVGLVAAALALPSLVMTVANIDQMEIRGNTFATELAGNGLFTITAAMRRNELDYDRFYRTMPQEKADAVLKQLGVEHKLLPDVLQTLDSTANSKTPFIRPPKNVVLISVESLSASFMGAYGAKDGLTPKLDSIAQNGLKFERLFATGTRTVRGLEALSLGTPPIPGQAIVRRPNNDHLATIGEILEHQGFATYFFYGGYGYFDNMNSYFSANDYHVIDRTDIPKDAVVFENVWGVADEVLFNQVIKTLDSHSGNGQPFFAQVMTTSNHRPYTYPDGRIDIPSPGGRSGAVKYTDYAIGKFIEDAKTKPWFTDTLFVIVADHCAKVAGKTTLPVALYHIPLIFYAPDLLKPGTEPHIVSQLDIAPSLIDALGKKGKNHFFGRSFFAENTPPDRAFVSNYQQLGYFKHGTLTVLLPKQKIESYRIDPVTYAATPVADDPILTAEAIAYYQTASTAFKTGAMRSAQHLAH